VSEIVVVREGSGPEVLLVHGGASPATTWSGLSALRERFTLAIVHRRGYPPSPPPEHRQDFEVDANDLAPLFDGRPHVVAHSYGGVAALIAAARMPARVRSLTLIEPPVYLLRDDPEVMRLQQLGDAVLMHGLGTEPSMLREFLRIAGAPVAAGEPLSEDVARGVRRAHGSRPPGEAELELAVLREARVRVLVASGGHAEGLERICDALAEELHAKRLVAAGAGHFVAAAPAFAPALEDFLASAG
jgi:pimeloyl-ACP methyl ester carboxylesterase